MSEILYLVHATSNRSLVGNSLKVSKEPDTFPGVYFSLITDENILREQLFPGKQKLLIFSKTLLKQYNWHLNIQDVNGIISEHNTLFPWNTEKEIVNALKQNNMNELVFHDDVPLKYLCKTIVFPEYILGGEKNKRLPRKVITNNALPDFSLRPFYIFCDITSYTGIQSNFTKNSSLNWYRMMAHVARINLKKTDNIQTILSKLKKTQQFLHSHREAQDIYKMLR
jgi:hypothetical protein